MQLIAHRGLTNDDIKENTMDAYINAIKNGYDGIELDVRLTKDNNIVCLHDKLINRTSDGKGNINDLTYKELLKYNFGTEKCRARIPLLKDVVKKINNSIIVIELKEEINDNLLDDILRVNKSNKYYICSFNKKYIDGISSLNYKKGVINYVFNTSLDISQYDFILILEKLFTNTVYNKLIENNVEPIIYGTLSNIKIKNKELINNIKYII